MEVLIPWILFTLFVVAALVLDLTVLHKKEAEIPVKESILMTLFWIFLAFIYCGGVYYFKGHEPALQFLAGYLIEKSLSVDNLFIFLLIFTHFQVPGAYQRSILFWGILGAIVMRLIFIFAGVALIKTFHWVIYIFGAFLVFTGVKLAFHRAVEVHPEDSIVLKLFRKMMRVEPNISDGRFFVKRGGKIAATPLFVALILIETSDVIFAMDSIPAIFAVTLDPFIVYTSNIFAILGLRSLFFALAGIMKMFRFLHYGLAIILSFLGIKMLIVDFYHIPVVYSLGFIAAVLIFFAVISAMAPSRKEERG